MTRKHFTSLAQALASTMPDPQSPDWVRWHLVAIAIAGACREHNPHFDASRFHDASGLNDAQAYRRGLEARQ